MANLQRLEDWLQGDKMIEWARDYLAGKGLLRAQASGKTEKDRLLTQLIAIEQRAEKDGPEIIRKMKAAWNQKTYRDQKGKNTQNMVLSDEGRSALKALAKDEPKNTFLNRLLIETHNEKQALQSAYKEKENEIKKNYEAKLKIESLKLATKYRIDYTQSVYSRIPQNFKDEQEANKEKITLLEAELLSALTGHHRIQVLMEDAKIEVETPLSDKQTEEVTKRTKSAINSIVDKHKNHTFSDLLELVKPTIEKE